MNGYVAGEDVTKQKRILPVWHKITYEEIYKKSPTIALRKALITADTPLPEMAKQIAKRIKEDSEPV